MIEQQEPARRAAFPGCSKAFSNTSDRAKHQNRTHSNEVSQNFFEILSRIFSSAPGKTNAARGGC